MRFAASVEGGFSVIQSTRVYLTSAIRVLGLLVIVLLTASCAQPVEDTLLVTDTEMPDARFLNLTRLEYRDGMLSMRISARKAEWFESDRRLRIEGLEFTTYRVTDGSITAQGQADLAILYESSGDTEFSGYILFRSLEDEVTFETDHLTYRRALDTFETPTESEVLVKARDQLILSGRSLLFDATRQYYELRDGVKGSVYR